MEGDRVKCSARGGARFENGGRSCEVFRSRMEGGRVKCSGGVPHRKVRGPGTVEGVWRIRAPYTQRIWVVGRCGTVHPRVTGWLVSASEGFRTWMCEVPTPREVWRKDGRTGDGVTEQVGVRSIGHRGMKEEE